MARELHTVWCDDVRMEAGNKMSLMGVYSSEMLVPSFPFVIDKLCLSCKSSTDIKKPFQRLKIVVTKDKDLVAEVDLTESLSQGSAKIANTRNAKDVAKFLGLQSLIVLRNIVINKPTIFRAKLISETGEIRGHGLIVRLVD